MVQENHAKSDVAQRPTYVGLARSSAVREIAFRTVTTNLNVTLDLELSGLLLLNVHSMFAAANLDFVSLAEYLMEERCSLWNVHRFTTPRRYY